ncbi:tRNA (adenosine(37)-N6)-threonylcarbamoyltransferase complex dimerization subunit type 1 TsaB [Thauera sinica]|uniref:tRNA (Adenosine(37)-N6)-threonylcarbamoyltransferase complex dimerization subunit type 1 TsaB n=1 Tax=Thauera sinica TaxID=2665146 RepID=A0ABW1AYJ3_9RHOO|nr:tRNA (adenosine(37)-N6)-threonylcarbamoyltransferase complex dimerization subunit type 1 TsaB [Thauera sp. K11]ATE60215.1 tRNA (adenosine(37)-N6)-threonylcarbamoyltransferase complex dimerization subunit type 1 TsaB [Thauera sp. K11]
MNILAIETSCETGSIALLSEGRILESELDGVAAHSEGVLPAIDWLLGEAGLAVSRLDAVAFGSGPGAFTGLRLACGVAQGLALGGGVGMVAICSLEALAAQHAEDRIVAATDARLGEIYCCAYVRDADGVLQAVGEPSCGRPDTLPLPPGEWFGAGSAFAVHAEALRARLAGRLSGCAPDAIPRARQVALLAARRVARGESIAPQYAAPLYVRDKIALTTAERLAGGGRA